MYLLMSSPLICSLTEDPRHAAGATNEHKCPGFQASWLLRMGLGAHAKKLSEPASPTCSSPPESRLPVWEVRERDTGQFQESTVAISTETEGVQEPIC